MDDDVEHDDLTCPECGSEEVYSQPCWMGCDDGFFDGYEDDPLWYDPGEMVVCSECGGRGFYRWCQNCGKDLTWFHFTDAAPVDDGQPPAVS